jgi:3-phosphoglycerate kinase
VITAHYKQGNLSGGLLLQRHPAGGESRKDTAMINKMSPVLTAIVLLGSVPIASAAATDKVVRQHDHALRGRLVLLENVRARAPAADTNAAVHFQNNWNVSY